MELTEEALGIVSEQYLNNNENPKELATVVIGCPYTRALVERLTKKALEEMETHPLELAIKTSVTFALCIGLKLGEMLNKTPANAA